MTQVLDLDQISKVTVKIQGKEYELNIPSIDTLEEYDKHISTLDSIKKPEDFKTFLQKFFVEPPSDEIMGQIKAHQYSKLLEIILDLVKGGAKTLNTSKKK